LKGFFDNVNNLSAVFKLVGSVYKSKVDLAHKYKMEVESYIFELFKNNPGYILTELNRDPLFKFLTRINESRPV